MSIFKRLLLGFCILALIVALAPGARASEWDQKVIATFNNSFQIPGQVLPPGTYVFKVLDLMGDRDIVRVTNADESQVIATAITVGRYREAPTDKPVFVFEERGADSPQALQAWYYPGYTDGHEFIYHGEVTPVAATAASTAPPPAPVMDQSSTPEESPVLSAEAEPQPAPQAAPQTTPEQPTVPPSMPTATTNTSSDTSNELPKTASTTPLIALIGILALGGAIGLKLLAVRMT
jgi:hypothetical protein